MSSDQPLGQLVQNVALRTWPGFIAFGFGSGLSPVAPGTVGTLAAIPLAIPFSGLPQELFWPGWLASFLLGVYVCGLSCRRLGAHDHGGVVWDEMVAWWLIVGLIPRSAAWWAAAFILFRLFDILKPWPIRQVDRRVHGGLGIMLDDILAALFSLACLGLFDYLT